MFSCKVNKGIKMIRQGDDASSFFIICKGQMEVIIDGKMRRVLKDGD
jgi:cGMP-dependent protein kinase